MLRCFVEAAFAATLAFVRALAIVALCTGPSLASQNSLFSPTSGTVSGLTLTNNYNSALDSVNTCNSGGSAPTNQLSGMPSAGNCWYNTSTGALSHFDGTSWLPLGYLDTTNHVFTPVTGAGAATTIASATTTNLCGSSGASPQQTGLTISGTATITSFGTNCPIGALKVLTFAAAATLTYNASTFILPTSANIITAAGDVAVAQYNGGGNWTVILYQRATGAALSTVGLNVGASALGASALGSFEQPVNLQINATASANQLTVALKGINGSDPSSTNPILVSFRDASSTGTQVTGSLQAALSFTLASTSSLGCVTASTCRVWLTAICQTITSGVCTSILVGMSAQSNATSCSLLDEATLQSTGAGTTGGSTIATIYTSVSTLSSKPIRIIGYVEATWTSGTGWGSPSNVQIFGPAVKRPCELVKYVFASSTSTSSTGSTSPVVSPLTSSITPASAANLIKITTNAFLTNPVGSITIFTQIYRNSLTALGNSYPATGGSFFSNMIAYDRPGSGSVGYEVFYWESGNTTSWASPSSMLLEEIMGALDPPANDNEPLRMVG